MNTATNTNTRITNVISMMLITIMATIVTAFSPKALAQPSSPGPSSHLTFTLPGGRQMVAKVAKVAAAHLEGDELAFEIKKDDSPDELADKLLSVTFLSGFESYAELRTNIKTGARTLVITRTRAIVRAPAVKRQLYQPTAPLKTPLV